MTLLLHGNASYKTRLASSALVAQKVSKVVGDNSVFVTKTVTGR